MLASPQPASGWPDDLLLRDPVVALPERSNRRVTRVVEIDPSTIRAPHLGRLELARSRRSMQDSVAECRDHSRPSIRLEGRDFLLQFR